MARAKTEAKELSTLDLYLLAFLSLHGVHPALKVTNSRVTFNFPVIDELYRLANLYNANEPVPVADFVMAVKALRGQMLTMRGSDKDA